jgi:hypothetical protein
MKFTIRDLLWLTVVVALAVGWWIDARRRDAANAQLTTELANATRQWIAAQQLDTAAIRLVESEAELRSALRNPTPPAPNPAKP